MAEAFLNVGESLSGKRWELLEGDDRIALAMAQRLGIPEVAGRVMASRGVSLDEAEVFLEPTLRALLPDPFHLKDMDKAADRLTKAIIEGEKIAVFGDYDVDGSTSSALVVRYLRSVGAAYEVYIPDRLTEGYGPNGPALEKLRGNGASLAVTVDCGTTAHDALQAGRNAGLDIIVIDHHEAESLLPPAFAVVNPCRLDETSSHRHMAAVGVTFLVLVALNKTLREKGFFNGGREPNLLDWLDIVALGTVCDVVPLKGVNRAFVRQGLKVMGKRLNPGITALSDVAGVDETPGAYHLGFILGPRVNAGGRVGQSDLASRLLAIEDHDEARTIAERLDAFNAERQEIEGAILNEAMAMIEAEKEPPSALAFAAGVGWHPGVIGIVASRMKERYNIPACAIAIENGMATGSARSISGVDFGAAVIAARQAGLLEKGGGHAMAAGFTLKEENLPAFRSFLAERFAARIAEEKIVPTLKLDGVVTVKGVSVQMVKQLEALAPYGAGNPEPRFAISGARIMDARPVGKDQVHVSCALTGPDGGRLKAIAFRAMESGVGEALLKHSGAPLHIAGRLRINQWQGAETAQFMIDDAAWLA